MEKRALSLDPEHLAALLDAFDHELLRRPGDEVRDDRVDRQPPAGDRDPRLSRWRELARVAEPPRLGVELERDRHLPDRTVGADR